ncbi:MAG: DNA repair protein RecO [Calditrichia bacterium]
MQIKTEAIVLQKQRWSDTSLIVQLLSREHGLIKLIAKGALRPKSQFHGNFEILNHLEVIYIHKNTRSLQPVSQSTILHTFLGIHEDLELTAIAMAILESLKRLIHPNEDTRLLFDMIKELLLDMDAYQGKSSQLFLIWFLFYLSHHLGFGWTVDRCAQCGNPPDKGNIYLDSARGAAFCEKCKPAHRLFTISHPEWSVLNWLQSNPSSRIAELQFLPQDKVRLNFLIDIFLSHINLHTEQQLQLKSLKMYLS